MREQYKEVQVVSWSEKLSSSCLGAFFGLFLFLISFFVLYWNETRVNLAEVAQTAVDISVVADPIAEGKLVSVTGLITANTPLGDDLFLLPGSYIFVDRTVEMYSWQEEEHTEREKHQDGSETKTTTYTYEPEWTGDPENSSSFRHTQNHYNPPKLYPDQLFKVPAAQIDRYSVDMSSFSEAITSRTSCADGTTTYRWTNGNASGVNLPESGYLQLNAQNGRVIRSALLINGYAFQGTGSPQTPQIGDVRVCYGVLPAEMLVTLFGTVNSANQISPYLGDRQAPLYRLIPGTRAAAIDTLGTEDLWWRWGFRGLGFLMMAYGLAGISRPLAAFLDMVPPVGGLAEPLMKASSSAVAFVLSTITILLSQLLHHPGGLMIAIGVAIAALLVLRRRR